MDGTAGLLDMAKKKSEARKHAGVCRMDLDAIDLGKKAAGLMGVSFADWASDQVRKAAVRDLAREAKKYTVEAK